MQLLMQVLCQIVHFKRKHLVTVERKRRLTSLLLLVYGVLKCVHVGLAAVECSSGDVHAHGVDAHIV